MALATYKRTKAGSSFRDQTGNMSMPSIDRNQAVSQIKTLKTITAKKATREEQTFLQNAKLGLNQGKMNETTYYNTLASFYEDKLNNTSDPLEQIKLQNKVFGYGESAKNAAESAAGRASSAASKAANSEYRELKNALFDLKADIMVKKLSGGAYENPGQFIDELSQLYETEKALYQSAADSDALSDSSRESALNRVKDLERDYSSMSGSGEYVGLDYQKTHKDTLQFVQKEGGKFPGQIDVEYRPELNGVDATADWVKGEDNIWRQAKTIGTKNDVTGDIEITDPVTGRSEKIPADDPRWSQYDGGKRKAVTIYDPLDPTKKRVFLAPMQEGAKWEGIGDIEGVNVDKPSFNPQITNFEERQPFQEDRSSLATTPFIAGGNMFGAEAIDQTTGQPQFGEGSQPKTPMQLSQEGPSFVDAEFKKPTFEKKQNDLGSFDFLKDGQKVDINEFMKGTGMSQEEANKGAIDIKSQPMSILKQAQKVTTSGFGNFKKFFQNIYG